MTDAVRYFRSLRFFHWAIFASIAVSVFTVVYYQETSGACYGGTVMGRRCYRGYFTNVYDTGGPNVWEEISNNQAIPSSTVRSADSLYNLIRAAYGSGDAQRRTGAAFIYNTMMGNNGPGVGRNISNAQWLDLRDRLRGLDQAGRIRWTGNVSSTINSYWQGGVDGFRRDGRNDDDAYYREYKNEAGIEIRDYNNNVIYKILRRCANPIGNSSRLPRPQNYTLTPHVDSLSPSEIEAESRMSVQTSVDNVGDIRSRSTRWEITQINVNEGRQAPHESNAGADRLAPCQSGGGAASGDYFRDGNSECRNVARGTGVFNLGTPAQNLRPTANNIDIGDLEVGTRVCFALSVRPHSNTDSRWMHSQPICTVVGKKPKIQVWGNDVAARGRIETGTTSKSGQVFGSWVEYGAFSVGVNTHFASSSGLNSQTNITQAAWSRLTFANVDDSGSPSFGSYATVGNFRPAPNVASYVASLSNRQSVGGSVNLAGLTFATGETPVVRTAGNLTITGGAIPAGRSVIIQATGTVTISGNISYTDADLSRINDIPQVVIIANNINIQSDVQQVDSWLVAANTINTCSNFTGRLTADKCNTALAVNGPVVTDRLLLNRTAGSGTGAQSGDPAERFNLRPDAFLWAQLQASGNNKAQTVYTTELPPRF